jgi:tetratricopeptide (TPR) repeat protein
MYDFIAVLCTLAFLFIALLLIHNLTVIIHELGHAIPKLLFTKSKVSVYLGSYGNNEKSIRINLGILEIYVKKHLFWSGGLCIGTKSVKHNWQNIIIVFCGPIASILIAILSIIFIKHFQLINFYMIIAIFFLMSSVFDLLHNLIPNKQAIVLNNGSIAYNDGQQIKMLLGYNKVNAMLQIGNEHYKKQNYREALAIFKELLTLGYETIYVIRLIVYFHIELKEYKTAYSYFMSIENDKDLSALDYLYLGLIKHKLHQTKESIVAYDKSLELDSSNILALNNKAYLYMDLNRLDEALNLLNKALDINSNFTLALNNKAYIFILKENYEDSIPILNKIIELDKNYAYAYNNRGHAYIKTGKLNEAFIDINKSMELDPSNSYAYRNLGMYYTAINDKNNAVINLNKAKELDPSTLFLEELFEEANKLLPHSF